MSVLYKNNRALWRILRDKIGERTREPKPTAKSAIPESATPAYTLSTDIPEYYNDTYVRTIPKNPINTFIYWEVPKDNAQNIGKTVVKNEDAQKVQENLNPRNNNNHSTNDNNRQRHDNNQWRDNRQWHDNHQRQWHDNHQQHDNNQWHSNNQWHDNRQHDNNYVHDNNRHHYHTAAETKNIYGDNGQPHNNHPNQNICDNNINMHNDYRCHDTANDRTPTPTHDDNHNRHTISLPCLNSGIFHKTENRQ